MIEVTMGQVVRDYRVALQRTLDHLSMDSVQSIAREILSAYDRDGRIYLCGNGGSAATASHMACDLAKNTAVADLPRLRVHALTDNTALISALANDIGYAAIFSEQLLLAPVTASDLVIAISGSGASPNVLNGVATAVAAGARTIGITGFGGGQLAPAVDVALIVPSDSMEIVEDAHLMVNHAVTSAIRSALQARAAVVA
jgi:D-sedoheptulose 7-phosphate isomerase